MQRRYTIALIMGIGVGLFAIASQAIDPWRWPLFGGDWPSLATDPFSWPFIGGGWQFSTNLWDWQLPDWKGSYLAQSAQRTRLIEQAYILKVCHLLLEQGLTYVMIPSVISCAYAKFEQVTQNNEVAKDFIASFQVSFGCFLFVSSAFTLTAMFSAFHLPGNWELRFLDAWRAFALSTILFPFVFPLTILGFAILFYKGRPTDRSIPELAGPP